MTDALQIRLASKDGRPVAGILTLRFRDTVVYKYGCLDRARRNLGGMHFLLWKAILQAKECGLTTFDFGRSDWDNPGLIAFKDRWGANRSTLAYWRYYAEPPHRMPAWPITVARRLVKFMPTAVLPVAGRLLYRHLGT